MTTTDSLKDQILELHQTVNSLEPKIAEYLRAWYVTPISIMIHLRETSAKYTVDDIKARIVKTRNRINKY